MTLGFTNKVLLFLLAISLFVTSCKQDEPLEVVESYQGKKSSEYDAKITTNWYNHTLKMVSSTSGYTPPVAARNFGYIGLALYESTRPGSDYKTLAGQLTGLTTLPKPENGKEYHWPSAANAALAAINTLFFPLPQAKKNYVDSIATIRKFYHDDFIKLGTNAEVVERSEKFGETIAKAIFEWSKTDVIGHEAYLKNFPAGYEVPTTLGSWEPTSTQLTPLQPYWGNVRAFVPGSIASANPAPPIAFSAEKTSAFYAQAFAVYDSFKKQTTEEKKIALYWADGGGTITPPGHSIAIAGQLITEKNEKLDRAAEMYVRVGMAVADAFICCWKVKYKYNVLRPVTYIQKYIDPAWKPTIATPPFPEYTSGHSSQAGAVAYTLMSIYGKELPFTDKTHEKRNDIDGAPRSYASFMEMAEEAAKSRLYGGIHFPMGNTEGLLIGLKIGKVHETLRLK